MDRTKINKIDIYNREICNYFTEYSITAKEFCDYVETINGIIGVSPSLISKIYDYLLKSDKLELLDKLEPIIIDIDLNSEEFDLCKAYEDIKKRNSSLLNNND